MTKNQFWIDSLKLNNEDDDTFVSILHEACKSEYTQRKRWKIEIRETAVMQWIRCYPTSVTLPQQGWKLHISANIVSAKRVLLQVLPVLLKEAAAFKIVASPKELKFLNQGRGGISQIGKFITVYPRDDDEAVRLAALLDEVTCGLDGPTVPSDRALHSHSLVYYRYGGIGSNLCIQTHTGALLPAIRTPENELVPDYRSCSYKVPCSIVDPFMASGVATELPRPSRIIGGRYLILLVMSASINHNIYLAADLEAARSCVIKGPGYIRQGNAFDRIAQAGTRNEAEVLARLSFDPHFPALYDLVEQDGSLYLVMEDLEETTLDAYMQTLIEEGRCMPIQQVIAWGQQLAELLDIVHLQGFVHGDVKPSNIMIDMHGQLYLIDFDLAHKVGEHKLLIRDRGTRGYKPFDQGDSQLAAIEDDVYGLGALLYFLLTGANPSFAPQPQLLWQRPPQRLRLGLEGSLAEIITRCLHEQPAARYSSLSALKMALEVAEKDTFEQPISFGSTLVDRGNEHIRTHYRTLAGTLLETLCAAAQPVADSDGLIWMSTHPLASGCISNNLCTGNGGVVLALTELAAELQNTHAFTTLVEGARWLSSASPVNQPLPGLYIGEAGRGAALLRAGQVLHDKHFIARAAQMGRHIASLPWTSPDIYSGTAGCLRFQLLLWDETESQEHLQAARACGEQLLATCEWGHNGEAWWKMPDNYGSLGGQSPLGYAHGAAGIADTLLDLFEVTQDEQLLPVIEGVGRWLTRQAVAALDDGSGLGWPKIEGGTPTSSFWCHGATGIGRFFLHAALCNVIPDAKDIAARAARAAARGTRWAGPTQCHGLAGNIEFLLDMYQATGEDIYLAEAFSLGSLLEAFATEHEGHLVFSSDIPDILTPDYLIGYAGVALCLLRLSAPERLPHLLSRTGFRTRKTT